VVYLVIVAPRAKLWRPPQLAASNLLIERLLSCYFNLSPTAALRQASVAERSVALPPVQGKEPQMASLFFTCPTTHQQAPTGIETDVQSLRAAWKATLNVKCPHCGEVHEISVRETFNGALKRPISLGHLGGPVRLPHLKMYKRAPRFVPRRPRGSLPSTAAR
jgi:hypothetical protein